jgi:hypothetical protein
MRPVYLAYLRPILLTAGSLALLAPSAFAGTLSISSPRQSSTVSGAVPISASASEGTPFHLEIWDNGAKMGDYFASSVNIDPALTQGQHITTILAVSNVGQLLNKQTVTYNVAGANAANTQSPGTLNVTSPAPGSTNSSAIQIAASANEDQVFHLEIWDNGGKLGDYFSSSVNFTHTFSQGAHIMKVFAVSSGGTVLNTSQINYTVGSNSSSSGSVNITSPNPGQTSISEVRIAASAGSSPQSLEIWDNGFKLGDVNGGNVNGVYVLPNGSHVLTVKALSNTGAIISSSSVNYNVAENCSNSRWAQCNLDQLPADNTQNDCNPQLTIKWVANPCGGGVQGVNPTNPQSTQIQPIYEGGGLPDQGNLTLNGHSVHLTEIQGANPSNVLFRGQSPSPTPSDATDSHWTLDGYVHLPDPTDHQAFELDAQYTAGGIWTKFYTECAFNMNNGTGFWAVFDSYTGGWIFLNGQTQNGQGTPYLPCNRSQFYQPWSGSGNPSFSGWHHVVWKFLRNGDGTVTYQSITFDGKTTTINFHPNSGTGGRVSDNGNYHALVQLDGVTNGDGQHPVVDAYVSEVNLLHTP